jgi:hypothetical protein
VGVPPRVAFLRCSLRVLGPAGAPSSSCKACLVGYMRDVDEHMCDSKINDSVETLFARELAREASYRLTIPTHCSRIVWNLGDCNQGYQIQDLPYMKA